MEGSHQNGSNWYRCRYVSRRDWQRPRAPGGRGCRASRRTWPSTRCATNQAERPFSPERLRLPGDELAASAGTQWEARDAELERLRGVQKRFEQALYRQALRLEEQEDPEHLVVKLAKLADRGAERPGRSGLTCARRS
jgi:hypothetical protein